MDYIGVKTYRGDCTPKGEMRFVGLFTSQAYVTPPSQIPLLRHKVETVLSASGYPAGSHAGKGLLNILDTFPRDELFQIGARELEAWCEGILDLETRPRVRAFTRIDRFDRFVSVLLYVPRDRYNTRVRERIGALLSETYDGRIAAFYPYFPEGPLVRVQFIVARFAGETPQADVSLLEHRIAEIVDVIPVGLIAGSIEDEEIVARPSPFVVDARPADQHVGALVAEQLVGSAIAACRCR